MLIALAVVWCTAWTLRSMVRMARGERQLAHLLSFVCWMFLVMPLVADYLFREPVLSRFPRIASAYDDSASLELYALYIAIIFPVLQLVGAGKERSGWMMSKPLTASPQVRAASVLVSLVPLLLAVSSPDPSIYQEYGAALELQSGDAAATWHGYIALSVRLSIFAIGILLLSQKRLTFGHWFLALLILFGDCWVYGKRSTVAMTLAIVVFALWQRGILRGGRLVLVGLAVLAGMLTFSTQYQETMRGDSSIGTAYEGFRVDFGRDLQVRTSIYSAMNDDVSSVLPDGVSTLPLYAMTYVPRDVWPDKPLPYAQYFTSAAFNAPPQGWGWGITTTIFDEWISNFGLVALVLCPVAYALLARWASGSESPVLKTLGLGVCILILIQHVTSFYGVFVLWFVLRLIESLRMAARGREVAEVPVVSHGERGVATPRGATSLWGA